MTAIFTPALTGPKLGNRIRRRWPLIGRLPHVLFGSRYPEHFHHVRLVKMRKGGWQTDGTEPVLLAWVEIDGRVLMIPEDADVITYTSPRGLTTVTLTIVVDGVDEAMAPTPRTVLAARRLRRIVRRFRVARQVAAHPAPALYSTRTNPQTTTFRAKRLARSALVAPRGKSHIRRTSPRALP